MCFSKRALQLAIHISRCQCSPECEIFIRSDLTLYLFCSSRRVYLSAKDFPCCLDRGAGDCCRVWSVALWDSKHLRISMGLSLVCKATRHSTQTKPFYPLARARDFLGKGERVSSEARPVLKCLYVAVRRLLKVRYGIAFDGQSDEGEWRAWYTVLGKPLKGFNEAALYARTCLGCGLAGFTALYTFPQLREQYFAALCLIFTFVGCFASVDLVRWRFNPVLRSLARLRSVSLELSEASTLAEKPDGDAEIDADEGD